MSNHKANGRADQHQKVPRNSKPAGAFDEFHDEFDDADPFDGLPAAGPGRIKRNLKPRKPRFPPLSDLEGDDEPEAAERPAGACNLDGHDEQDEGADASEESFLLGDQGHGDEAHVAPSGAGENWFKSKAYQDICREGAPALRGNYRIGVPLWLLYYFQDIERAVLFAQILFWFTRSKRGKMRVGRWENGHPVIDKTHQELAREVGLKNARRIEQHLKVFKAEGLLDYDPHHGTGKGRTTRIWLIPEGVLKAYEAGCKKVEDMAAK